MKIERFTEKVVNPLSVKEALQMVPDPNRPLGETVCKPNCAENPAQNCHPCCPSVPAALSIDPALYPLEGKIAPLVFVFKQLQVFQTCWSCEGHVNSQGELWKLPRVWFYAQSPVHIRLLNGCLMNLQSGEYLNHPWQIVVETSSPDNPDPVYSLQPNEAGLNGHSLETLQKDVSNLVQYLPELFFNEARKLMGAAG